MIDLERFGQLRELRHHIQVLLNNNDNIIISSNILKKRQKILFHSLSKQTLRDFSFHKMNEFFSNNVKNIDQISYDTLMFQVSFIINGTKCFESFSSDQDGRRRFQFSQQELEQTIHINIQEIRTALFYNIKVKLFKQQHVIDIVVRNVRQNYEIVKLIAGKDFTKENLDQFLSIQEYKAFEFPNYRNLARIQALSSYDGRIVYIRDDLDYTIGKEYSEPDHEIDTPCDGVLDCESNLAFIWLIEYQLMENLSRWSSNQNVLSISPERNENLRDKNNHMIGTGNFYLTKAHKYKNSLNPFQMNNKAQSSLFKNSYVFNLNYLNYLNYLQLYKVILEQFKFDCQQMFFQQNSSLWKSSQPESQIIMKYNDVKIINHINLVPILNTILVITSFNIQQFVHLYYDIISNALSEIREFELQQYKMESTLKIYSIQWGKLASIKRNFKILGFIQSQIEFSRKMIHQKVKMMIIPFEKQKLYMIKEENVLQVQIILNKY
ncbi:hypothetical protein pb186bvf_017749 [Paramecium bursaria]